MTNFLAEVIALGNGPCKGSTAGRNASGVACPEAATAPFAESRAWGCCGTCARQAETGDAKSPSANGVLEQAAASWKQWEQEQRERDWGILLASARRIEELIQDYHSVVACELEAIRRLIDPAFAETVRLREEQQREDD
jgi:hypothetical protein